MAAAWEIQMVGKKVRQSENVWAAWKENLKAEWRVVETANKWAA
jgi:hypothetical protein